MGAHMIAVAVSKFLLLALVLLVSGCGSQLQKSLNRSVMIAKHCADIEEAVPLNNKKLELALINAISLRLMATCVDGSQQCLDPASGQAALSDPITSASKLKLNLTTHRDQLGQLNKQFLQTNRAAVDVLQGEYASLDKEVEQASRDASSALSALQTILRDAHTMLTNAPLDARACERRTNCVAVLAQRLASIRPRLEDGIAQLLDRVERLHALGQRATSLAEQTASFIASVPAGMAVTVSAQRQSVATARAELNDDTAALAASSKRLIERLQAGSRSLKNLFSGEVQEAATALMAARLYDKAADRTLAAVDRMLAQVDRTIDQVDSHVYGAATIGTYVFQSEMQEKLDQVFKTLVVDRLPDNRKAHTAKLAFAAAACRRLVPEDGKDIKNASMFSPFVFATLVHVDAGLRGEPLDRVRAEWEASLSGTAPDAPATGVNPPDSFIHRVTIAYDTESSTDQGRVAIAPSMLQQVALCANVEHELASTQQLNSEELANRTRTACGRAVVAATMMGEALPQAANPALARLAIEKAPAGPASGPSGQPATEDASAWRRAMEAVLAAAVPTPPSQLDMLCQRIKSATLAAHCDVGGMNGALTLDFSASFASGKAYDRALEIHMARLADMLNDGKQAYIVTVYGYASSGPFPCTRRANGTLATCAEDKNVALAQARANWALGVLKKRLGERMGAESIALGQFNPVSFDTPADRRIRMKLALRN